MPALSLAQSGMARASVVIHKLLACLSTMQCAQPRPNGRQLRRPRHGRAAEAAAREAAEGLVSDLLVRAERAGIPTVDVLLSVKRTERVGVFGRKTREVWTSEQVARGYVIGSWRSYADRGGSFEECMTVLTTEGRCFSGPASRTQRGVHFGSRSDKPPRWSAVAKTDSLVEFALDNGL